MARIEDNNLLAGQYSYLSQKNEIGDRKKSDKTKRANRSSLFSKLLNDSENVSSSQSPSDTMWGDDYQSDVSNEMKQIGLLGERIKKSNNFADVQEYKRRVKHFLENVIAKSEKIETRITGSAFRGTLKSKSIIAIIDKELNELTREFVATQISTIKVAASIDRIQGLLVDLTS